MKTIAIFVPTVISLLMAISGALAQDDRGQFESVQLLSDRRNMTIVRTCPLVLVNRLSCNLTSVMDDRLIIQDQVFLTIIDIRIRTCNSSLWPVFTFSNGTVVDNAADYLQCSRKIPLGQLTIMFGLNVRFMNETSRLIVIDTSVHAWQGDRDISLFEKTGLILTAQYPLGDNCPTGVTNPPTKCNGVATYTFSIAHMMIITFVAVAVTLAIVN